MPRPAAVMSNEDSCQALMKVSMLEAVKAGRLTAALEKHMPAKEAPISLKMCVQGIDYAQLMADGAARDAFEASVKATITDGRDLREEDVTLELSGGSVIVKALIVPPPGSSSKLLSSLKASEAALASTAVQRVSTLPCIKSISNGEIRVDVVGIQAEPVSRRVSPKAASSGAKVAEVPAVPSAAQVAEVPAVQSAAQAPPRPGSEALEVESVISGVTTGWSASGWASARSAGRSAEQDVSVAIQTRGFIDSAFAGAVTQGLNDGSLPSLWNAPPSEFEQPLLTPHGQSSVGTFNPLQLEVQLEPGTRPVPVAVKAMVHDRLPPPAS